MSDQVVREPIGLRVLLRALRPEDDVPVLLWRVDAAAEAETLIEAGEEPAKARLWAGLLRWSEAERVRAALERQGWIMRRLLVRVILLERIAPQLQPPDPGSGWPLEVDGIALRAVPEAATQVSEDLRRMLAFLEASLPDDEGPPRP
jgi:hypothetical protein